MFHMEYLNFEMQALESCLSCMELDQSSMQHNDFFI